MQETQVQSLSWEDLLEKEMPTYSSILAWPGEFHGLYNPWGRKESDTTERLSLSLSIPPASPSMLLQMAKFHYFMAE